MAMSKSYTKDCRDCNQQIRMEEVSGKWSAFDLSGTGFHKCEAVKNQTGTKKVEMQPDGKRINTVSDESLTLERVDARLKRLESMLLGDRVK